MRLCWLETFEDRFSRIEAHMSSRQVTFVGFGGNCITSIMSNVLTAININQYNTQRAVTLSKVSEAEHPNAMHN